MANRKTRALRRAEYLRQRDAMDAQAREAMAAQSVPLREEQEKHGDSSGGEVCQQIQLIPLACIVTEEYQRVMNMRNVSGIVKHFDPAKLGVLVVSHRKDGTYAVLDGQHRLTALRKLGYTATNCIVLEGMSIREEADYLTSSFSRNQCSSNLSTFLLIDSCFNPCILTKGTHAEPLC